jgi:hypothetical protein
MYQSLWRWSSSVNCDLPRPLGILLHGKEREPGLAGLTGQIDEKPVIIVIQSVSI